MKTNSMIQTMETGNRAHVIKPNTM